MTDQPNIDEPVKSEVNKSKPVRKKGRAKLMYNRWLVKGIPFYLFAAALAIIYIANGHYADKTIRKINATAKHLKEMEYEFKTIKRDVIFRSKESELAKAVEPLGLKELVVPPVKLTDTVENK
ncbi:MAG: FtsL-like putative cell division protein [Bacteroidota bacterium]|nr:FtsL-like putative cell division protein [Bacteroidota bacterium]